MIQNVNKTEITWKQRCMKRNCKDEEDNETDLLKKISKSVKLLSNNHLIVIKYLNKNWTSVMRIFDKLLVKHLFLQLKIGEVGKNHVSWITKLQKNRQWLTKLRTARRN